MITIEVEISIEHGKAAVFDKPPVFSSANTMEGPELTTNAKAAIENFVLLSINHSLGSAELESSSAGIIVYGKQLRRIVADLYRCNLKITGR
jgi:hypothetical protein